MSENHITCSAHGETPWRQFPAIWGRVHAPQSGVSDPEASLLKWLDEFMALMQPQRLFPYVWVVTLAERIVNANGHAWWVAFCYVSDRADHVHENAALVWKNGVQVRNDPLRFRYGDLPESELNEMIRTNHPDLVPLPRDSITD